MDIVLQTHCLSLFDIIYCLKNTNFQGSYYSHFLVVSRVEYDNSLLVVSCFYSHYFISSQLSIGNVHTYFHLHIFMLVVLFYV